MTSENCPKVLFTRLEIDATVQRLAESITRDYHDKFPVIIGVLKGSFIFTADLVRRLDFPLEVEFIRLSSYGSGKERSGDVNLIQGLHVPVHDRNILLLEDIVDTGHTISFLIDYFKGMEPASVRLCALTDKPSRREVPVTIDYLGFTVPNKFIVGYGIDWDEKFRYLPDICVIE